MYIKTCFIIMFTGFSYLRVKAQVIPDTGRTAKQITYLLPDNSILPGEKIDSLERAWGKGRVAFVHSPEDDEKGIIHLIRLTDEMINQSREKSEQEKNELRSILNKPPPDFVVDDLQGKRWSSKDLKGKIVVLNFWFTSCIPCIREMPELNKLVKSYDSKDVVFLAITFNDVSQIKAFQKTHTFDFTLIPDSKAVIERYKVTSYPTSIVIDKKGNAKTILFSSPKIGQELSAAINTLL